MDIEDFESSIKKDSPPTGLTPWLIAMWYDAKGQWKKAHDLVQDLPDDEAAWIHAYLHRKEGDIFNADYWYRRADRSRPEESLQNEWRSIVRTLLEAGSHSE